MRAAIYLRISQDGMGEKAGVTRQRADCERMCADRGYEVLELFEDNSVSPFSGGIRPSWERKRTRPHRVARP